MNTTKLVQKLAQIKLRHSRSTELQEWLECNDFLLAMKSVLMGHSESNLGSLRHFIVRINDFFITANGRNPKIAALLPHAATWFPREDRDDVARVWAMGLASQLLEDRDMLLKVGLNDKREVLRYMRIITTPVAAAFLGITEDMLNNMKSLTYRLFGSQYAGGHCYSLEELNLIAQNLGWASGWDHTKAPEIREVDSGVLDYAIHVDEATAMAITDTTAAELLELTSTTEHTRRPYRLADLEKIRIAKQTQAETFKFMEGAVL